MVNINFLLDYLICLTHAISGNESTKDKILSYAVAAATIGVTFLAMWYLLGQMEKVKSDVIYQRRKARLVFIYFQWITNVFTNIDTVKQSWIKKQVTLTQALKQQVLIFSTPVNQNRSYHLIQAVVRRISTGTHRVML